MYLRRKQKEMVHISNLNIFNHVQSKTLEARRKDSKHNYQAE